jgi:Zn ribbon nucleic-acid-binding protein
MKIIKDKIKTVMCTHDFERTVFYWTKNLEIKECVKCGKKKEVKH